VGTVGKNPRRLTMATMTNASKKPAIDATAPRPAVLVIARAACVWLLAVGLPAMSAESKKLPIAGIYEGLMLAVAPDVRVTDSFQQAQGEGVVKQCRFLLVASSGAQPMPVTTWATQAFSGTLVAEADSVALKVARLREHPGCASVLPPDEGRGAGAGSPG
jgi:hypothetical protein